MEQRLFPLLILLAGLLAGAPASAEVLGEFGPWAAAAAGDGDSRQCYAAAKPEKAEGNYDKRGDIYAMVTHRPGANAFDEVSFHQGYTLKEGSEVEVSIGGATVFLFARDGRAWAYQGDDAELVRLMKRGLSMVVKGTSWRGTLTTDTYSLEGFTAAYKAASEACGK